MEKAIVAQKIITAGSAQNTSGYVSEAKGSQLRELTFIIKWSTGVSAGAIKIEAAADVADTDSWAPLATVTYAAGSPHSDIVQITGCEFATRARISTAVVGGTVDVDAAGN